MKNRIPSYVPRATSSQGGGWASRPRTGNSPSPRKLPVVCVSRECHHSHSQRPVLHSPGGKGGSFTLFASEWLPLELCKAGALATRFLDFSWCFLFRRSGGGRTVTSALGVFPSLAEVQSPHLFPGCSFWFLLPLLTDAFRR